MTDEQLNEYRIFNLAAGAILPLIESMHQNAYEKLLANFREGKAELTNSVARAEALYSLLEEIKAIAATYEHYTAKRSAT